MVSFITAASDNDDSIQARASSRSGRIGKQLAGRKRAAPDSEELQELPEGRII